MLDFLHIPNRKDTNMELKKAKWSIRQVARNHGLAEEEVVKEIEIAIQAAFEAVLREKDAAAIERWREIPCAGVIPNAYELVDYLSCKLNNS